MKRLLLILVFGILNLDAIFAENFIDVLIVYTPAVEEEHTDADGVEALVISAFESANRAFSESKTDTQLRLVDVRKVNYVEDPDDMGTDLEKLSEQDGVMDSVLQWRSELGADLVCLVRYGQVDTTAGIAWLMNSPNGRRSTGFSVVASENMIVGATFQHEIGHNLGAGHDRENAGEASPLFDYSYGHRFDYPVNNGMGSIQYRTLMAYQPGNLVNLFSNPDVSYLDMPVGVASGEEAADNARTIRETAPYVASYYAAVGQAPVAAAGEDVSVEDTNGDGVETILLDGSSSSAESGIVSWDWTWNSGSESGEQVVLTLPVGQTVVTLEVTDGDGTQANDTVIVDVAESPGAERVFAGEHFTFILKEDGTLLATGDNSNGQLGIGSLSDTQRGFSKLELSGVEAVSAGQSHTLFLLNDGRVFGAGSNEFGQLGEYPSINYASPTILDVEDVVAVGAGDQYSLFLLLDGSVVGMGTSARGTLGEAGLQNAVNRVELVASGVESLEVGGDFAAVLKTDGSVLVWGAIGEGLEEGEGGILTTPVEVVASGAAGIAAGKEHLLILMESGEVLALGRNQGSGALGVGRNDVLGVVSIWEDGAESIWATDYASYIRLENGEVLGSGVPLLNVYGEFDSEPQFSFVPVFSGQGIEVVGGRDFLLIKRNDGVSYVLGSNDFGQLGLDSTDPVTAISEIAFGYNATVGGNPPTASAATLRTRVAIEEAGSVSVRLDGSVSSDDWFIERYLWTWDEGSAEGRLATAELSTGDYSVTLTVYDQNGNENSDTIEVQVISYEDWLSLFFSPQEIAEMETSRSSDFDGDGLSNAQEALLGLIPSDFESRLKFGYIDGPEDLRTYLEGIPSDLEFLIQGTSDGEVWEPVSFELLANDLGRWTLNLEESEAKLFRVAIIEE